MTTFSADIAIFMRCLYEGGAERVMLNLASDLIKRDLKVDLVLVKAEGGYLSQIPPEVRLIDLKANWKPGILPKLMQYLKQEKPKSMLVALHYPCEIALLAKRLSRVSTQIIVSEHNHLSQEAKRIKQISVRLTPLAAKIFYPWADGIIAVSGGVAEDLAKVTKIPRNKIQLIYNPVIFPEMFEKAKESVEHPWFKPGSPPVILGVGRFYPQKDFQTLIRAFAVVRKIRPAKLILLGGDGPELPKLKELIANLKLEEDVAILGFAANPYAYMAKASVFVLSSAWEGLPTVLIEAMAIGTPVVSTDCPSGPSEILDGGKYGWLTPVGDSKAMAEKILKVLSGEIKKVDPAWLDRFTLEVCTEEYLKILGFPNQVKTATLI
jgi:glycosyltransferase involved in cell wall biosynthesis